MARGGEGGNRSCIQAAFVGKWILVIPELSRNKQRANVYYRGQSHAVTSQGDPTSFMADCMRLAEVTKLILLSFKPCFETTLTFPASLAISAALSGRRLILSTLFRWPCSKLALLEREKHDLIVDVQERVRALKVGRNASASAAPPNQCPRSLEPSL